MMKKLMVLGAAAAGYVLGARAGRERYEQIARGAQKLRSNPSVQQKVGAARHAAQDAAGAASDRVRSHKHTGGETSGGNGSMAYSTETPGTATNGLGRGDDGV